MWQNITCTPFFDAPWVHGTPHFITLTCTLALKGILGIVCPLFFNLQFNKNGSSLTDPQKFRLTPGFQRRGQLTFRKKEAQETLSVKCDL